MDRRRPPRARRSGERYLEGNERFWDRTAAGYEAVHAPELSGDRAMAWGMWRVPERQLGLLGDVRGRSVLELGCGAARWSAELRRVGARVVALDLSMARLGQAVETRRRSRQRFEIVRASADRLPFAGGAFDIAFCDFGALTFADPHRTIPEAARVLRPGGRLAFATSNPWRWVTHSWRTDRAGRRLERPYFDQHRLALPDGSTEFQLSYSDWFELFRASGLAVDRLVELPSTGATRSRYLNRADERWARRWPIETFWSLHRDGTAGPAPP